MVHTPISLFQQQMFSSACLAVDKGLGDVKHHEFSNLHNLKIQDVLYTLKILFSVFCNIAECYRIFLLCVCVCDSSQNTGK